ncbi:MAG: hypothetical protein U1F43_10385 [Myxococcota bacterium]
MRLGRRVALAALAVLVAGLGACSKSDPRAQLGALQDEALALATRLADDPSQAGEALTAFVDDHGAELAAIRQELVALQSDDPKRGELAMAQVIARRDEVFVRWSALVRDHPGLAREPRALRAMRRLLQ